MSNFFSQKIPIFKPRRSVRDLTISNHLTSRQGLLTPFDCIPTDPGDRYKLGVTALGRTLPLRTPVMAQLRTKFAWYHVPYSIVWKNFNKFYTSGGILAFDGELPPEMPQASMDTLSRIGMHAKYDAWHRSLFDYLDYPAILGDVEDGELSAKNFSILPLLAYAYIWSEYYINENIQERLDIEALSTLNGDVATWTEAQQQLLLKVLNYGDLRRVNWNKDYLTASRPYTQKGKQVVIPLNVTLENFALRLDTEDGPGARFLATMPDSSVQSVVPYFSAAGVRWVNPSTGQDVSASDVVVTGLTTGGGSAAAPGDSFSRGGVITVADSGIDAPANVAFTAIDPATQQPIKLNSELTINDLRTSSAAQRLLESMAVGGTHIKEYLLVQHGVKLSDKTAQRPEFIGGDAISVQIGEVLQTSESTNESALGRLGGTGYTRGKVAMRKFYTEQAGVLLGLMWTKPPTAYMWGVPRYLAKLDALEFMNPHFANLGDQEVFDFEAMRLPEHPDRVFGYLGRYDDLRARLNRVHADMRTTLAEWHAARDNEQVALNEDFVQARPTTRYYNVTDNVEDTLVHQVVSHVKVRKNIPSRSDPRLL